MADRITGANRLLARRTKLTHVDYKEILEECLPSDVIYLDPPYQGVCKERDARYITGISHQCFIAAVERLIERGCRVIISYDGRTGEKRHGAALPHALGLVHEELAAGRSTQATLLGRSHETFESLYVSPSLACRPSVNIAVPRVQQQQMALFAI